MERQKLLQYINKMTKVLAPIIDKDPDIIDFIEESELTKDQVLAVKLWFTSACIVSSFNEKNKDALILIKKSMENMKKAEKYLDEEGDFENVHDILMDEFKDNCDEWFGIIKKESCFKPFLRVTQADDEDVEENNDEGIEQPENNDLPRWFNVDMKVALGLLGPIFSKEEDIEELMGRLEGEDLKQKTLYLLACAILGLHLERCLGGEEKAPDFAPFQKDMKYALKFFQNQYNAIVKELSKNMNNFKAFNDLITDVVDTHYKEFMKKFYKNLLKALQEMAKAQQDKQ